MTAKRKIPIYRLSHLFIRGESLFYVLASGKLKHWLICLAAAISLLSPAAMSAKNTVEAEQLSYDNTGQRLMFNSTGISNAGNCTSVTFNIECQDLPFSIDSLQIMVCDTLYSSLSGFSFAGTPKDVNQRRWLWRVKAEFPQLFSFSEEDELRLFTSEGEFCIPLHPAAITAFDVDALQKELSQLKASGAHREAIMWIVGVAALACVMASLLYAGIKTRRCRKRMAEAECRIEQRMQRLEGAKEAVLSERKMIMRKGFEVFNSLCNEYFEKCDSELTRATLVKDVENIISSYRPDKAIDELCRLVDLNMDNILTRIKEEIPSMSESDLQFLTYLYAGFSPRAVCLMTDLKLKNFYNRRPRLRDKILAGDAPHREWFAAEMQPHGA